MFSCIESKLNNPAKYMMKVPAIIALLGIGFIVSSSYTESLERDQDNEEELLILDIEEEILAEENNDQGLKIPEGPVECSRFSPQEMFFIETQPRLIKSIDELSVCLETILFKTEEALRILLPRITESPLGTIKLERVFDEMRSFVWDRLNGVFEDIRRSWYGLFYIHTTLKSPATQQLEAVIRVRESLELGERTLLAVTKEIMLNIKAIVVNSVQSIGASTVPDNAKEDNNVAGAVHEQLPELAPNFLGTLMAKMLVKGTDPKAYKKMDLNIFKPLLDPIMHLVEELESLVEAPNNGTTLTLEDLWLTTINTCHERLHKSPIHEEDYEALFTNEEYLAELTLSLMASF